MEDLFKTLGDITNPNKNVKTAGQQNGKQKVPYVEGSAFSDGQLKNKKMEKLEFKGTRGEWLVKENKTRFPSCLTDEVIDENGDVLFKVFLANNDIEYKSNSKLIAVAPQLLECLQQMVEMYEEVQPCGGYQGHYDEAVHVIKKALM